MKDFKKGTYKLKSEADTEALGLSLAGALEQGDIVALTGDLGVGKTALSKYIAEGLGVRENIVSPTFTIVKLYESGRIPLAHFDLYRLGGYEELMDIGSEEIIGGRYVSLIEWADMVSDYLPEDALLIHLTYGASDGERFAEIL